MNSRWSKWKFFKLYVLASLQNQSAYKGAAIIWIINGFITPMVMAAIWLTIQSQQQSFVLNSQQVVSYYLLTILVSRLTQTWSAERLGHKIRDGAISTFLIHPTPYYIPYLAHDFASKIIRLLTLVPFILGFVLLMPHTLAIEITPSSIFHFLTFSIMGYFISFILEQIVGLSAVWLTHIDGAVTIYSSVSGLMSGFLIPFALMPHQLKEISQILPFHFILNIPISALMQTEYSQSFNNIYLLGAIWFVILLLIWKLVFRLAIKNYEAVGI